MSTTTAGFCASHAFLLRSATHTPLPSHRRKTASYRLHAPRTTVKSALDGSGTTTTSVPVETGQTPGAELPLQWNFRGATVEYLAASPTTPSDESLPAAVLVHGFGANCKHWRKNVYAIASRGYRVFAMDLLGFGMGDKPNPGTLDATGVPVAYDFDYWTAQLREFVRNVVQVHTKRPVFLVANSIGCIVTMQFAVEDPSACAAQVFISPAMRMLNVRKRSWLQNIIAPLLMKILAYRPFGAYFLESLSRPEQLRKVLYMAYGRTEAVDDSLVQALSQPARTPGALEVFLAFIMYDEGPIPEDFLPHLSMPSLILWGIEDTFEPYELGLAMKHYATVERFVSLPGVGHCAHDEEPETCNDAIVQFFQTHSERVYQ